MTLNEYYKAWDKVEAPANMSFLEEREFYRSERKRLQSQLNRDDLKTVLTRQRNWQDKMQSSVG